MQNLPSKTLAGARGFTLVELMIVVAIVAILAVVAFPSYQDSVRKSNRAAAESYLMDLAQRQQQYLNDARSFATTAAALGTSTPSTVSPYYTVTITVAAGSPPSYSLAAAPIGTQVSDSCGTLTLTSAGAKTSSAGSRCW